MPLGDTYLELVAVVDEGEAAQSLFGRWVAGTRPTLAEPLGWAVRTHDVAEVARRLDLTIIAGSRATRDGRVLRWQLAGMEQAAAEPSLPFFLEWAQGTPFPGRVAVSHPAGPARVAELQLDGDADRLTTWLGGHALPITVRPGTPALRSIVLTAAAGRIVLGADQR